MNTLINLLIAYDVEMYMSPSPDYNNIVVEFHKDGHRTNYVIEANTHSDIFMDYAFDETIVNQLRRFVRRFDRGV